MNLWETIAMVIYLVLMIGIGIYFFFKGSNDQDPGEKEYFLGGRNMNGWVAALSAGASDMSAWVLMGLPGAFFLYGMGQVWVSVGLFIGTLCAWAFVAPRIRRYSIRAKDSITIPQFLTNRFLSENKSLQIVSAIVFVIVYCVYSASSISACGTLFNTVVGIDRTFAMILSSCVIIIYTFLGGFDAVCWTDFFQGMLMLAALMLAPIIAVATIHPESVAVIPQNYYNVLETGKADWKSISTILSGLGWGLGYFGMPHIVVRYISIRSEKEMKKSRIIGTCWTGIILIMATIVGMTGLKLGLDGGTDGSLIFINMVRVAFPAFIGGILLAAILAASMSTADSQLLASSSAFASDVYKQVIRKNASNREMLWVGRIIVIIISIVAFFIASNPNCGGIMELVSNAWAGFGSAFSPVIILALFWKRFTYSGAVAGIATGFVVDVIWLKYFAASTGLYEIIPGFICGLLAAVIVSLLSKKPSQEVCDLFEAAKEEI